MHVLTHTHTHTRGFAAVFGLADDAPCPKHAWRMCMEMFAADEYLIGLIEYNKQCTMIHCVKDCLYLLRYNSFQS